MSQINLRISKKIFNDVYFPYLFSYCNRYQVYYGSAGSGKSVFAFQKMIIKALTNKRRVLVIRKVERTIRDSVFQLSLNILSQFQLLDKCKVNRSTFTITLPNDSQLLFKGCDNPEKLKSITGITDILIEEATQLTYDEYSQLDLRLREKVNNLQIFLCFNPVSKANWVYKHFFQCSTPPNTFILKTTYKDNKFLPKQYVAAIEGMKETNPTYYRIYGLGQFCSLDRLVFPVYQVGVCKEPEKLKLLCGLDFGYINDPTAFVVSYLDENNNTIWVDKEFYETGLLNNQIADRIKYMGLAKSVIIADSAEQKSIEEIKREGITKIKPATKGKGSILQGLQKLQQYRIVINPSCSNTLVQFQNYSWTKDKSGEYVNQPIDKFNHCIDALRYSLQCAEIKAKLKTLPSNVL